MTIIKDVRLLKIRFEIGYNTSSIFIHGHFKFQIKALSIVLFELRLKLQGKIVKQKHIEILFYLGFYVGIFTNIGHLKPKCRTLCHFM